MKLKLLLLLGVGVAGFGASYALAASTKGPHDGDKRPSCKPVHLRGTLASPSSFVLTVQKGPKDTVTTGQVVTVTLGGGTGQTVLADAEACVTGTGATLTTRHVNIHVSTPHPEHPGRTTTTTGTTTTTP
ncbi:MAG: hypothetical protein ACRDL2_14850 [Gaiellaceae bacterium]